MSLKAKIEAVIYAAEEPVTLAQLAAIFAEEVPPHAAEAAQPETQADHELTTIDEAGNMADVVPPTPEAGQVPIHDLESEPAPLLAEQPELLPVGEQAGEQAEDLAAAARRAARLRDREVRDHIRSLIDELIADFADPQRGLDRGIEIREIAGGYRMATKPEYHDAVRAFVKNLKPAMKLSPQALETLAVIAYKQPVTGPEIGEIRGVDSGGVLASLISRKLVTTAGRKQVIGRPILYKTTKEFLLGFGLKDLSELPSMEEFEKMAGELAESDALEAEAMNEKAGIPESVEDPDSQSGPAGTERESDNDRSSVDLSSRPEHSENENSGVSEPAESSELSSRPKRSEVEESASPSSSEQDQQATDEQVPEQQEI